MESTHLKTEEVKEQLSNIKSSPTSTGATGMRRDHESIDDFEHLEPDSSPVKETPTSAIEKGMYCGTEPIVESGKEFLTSSKFAESQNSSDFSLLSDSKLDSPATDIQELAEPSPKNITDAANGEWEGLPDPKSDKPASVTLQSQFLSGLSDDTVSEKRISSDSGIATHIENKFDKLSDAKSLSEAFMTTEREEILAETANTKGDKKDYSSEFLQLESLKSESDLHIEKPVSTSSDPVEIYSSGEPDPSLSFAVHTRDDLHDDDSFKDTDSLPEVVKPDGKSLDPTAEYPKHHSALSDGNEDYEEEDYDIPLVQESSPKLSDKLDQYQTKLPHEQKSKVKEPESESEPELDLEIHSSIVTEQEELALQKAFVPSEPVKSTSTVSEPSVKPSSSVSKSEFSAVPEPVADETSRGEAVEPALLYSVMGLDAWFQPDRLHPKVVELVYWRDPKKSGAIFGSVLGVLLSLSYFSLISVVAYLSLAVLTGTIAYRIYKNVMQALQKTSEGHPFKDILDLDLTLPQDKVREVTDVAVAHLNAAAAELRRLFLVEDLVDSIKFGILLWCLTYVGSWFNGMTLIIIAFVALFTLPKVYENNKVQIDQNLELVRSKLADITAKVKTYNPISKKPPAEEVKKEQ